jgi:hypothetical protein
LAQHVTTICWTLSAIRQQNTYTLQLWTSWQKSRTKTNITVFSGLATTFSEKELCQNELWAGRILKERTFQAFNMHNIL